MSLVEFLTLTQTERNNLYPLLELSVKIIGYSDSVNDVTHILSNYDALNSKEKKTLHAVIKSVDLASLIKLAITNPQINVICSHPLLNDIWNEKLRQSGRNPREKALGNHLPIHEYIPQPTLPTFELLKGLYLYSQYSKHNKAIDPTEKKEALSYLMSAAMLGYFPALNALCTKALQHVSDYPKALAYAETAAKLYWTPGYLVLAVACFVQKNYLAALRNLIIAEKLIPYSAAQINNAYQGKTLHDIATPLMQQLQVKSFIEAKQQLAELANVPIVYVTSHIYTEAQSRVAALLHSISAPVDNEEENETMQARPGG